MLSLRLSVSAVFLAVLAATASAQSVHRRQAPGLIQCAAAVYEDVPRVLASCNFVNLYNITVPAGKSLDLRAVQPNSVIFIGRAITFLPSPGFAGPLVRFGGSGLYVNGGTGFFDGVGSAFWASNSTATPPTLVSIENVQNSTFEKLIVANSPATAVSITGSSGLLFKGARVLNQAAFVASPKPVLPGVVVASSSNIILGGFNVTTTGPCISISSDSTAQVVASVCNGVNLTANGTPVGASQSTNSAPAPQSNTTVSSTSANSTASGSSSSSSDTTTSSSNTTASTSGTTTSSGSSSAGQSQNGNTQSNNPVGNIIGSIFGHGGNSIIGGNLGGFLNGGKGGLVSGGKADGTINGIRLWG